MINSCGTRALPSTGLDLEVEPQEEVVFAEPVSFQVVSCLREPRSADRLWEEEENAPLSLTLFMAHRSQGQLAMLDVSNHFLT